MKRTLILQPTMKMAPYGQLGTNFACWQEGLHQTLKLHFLFLVPNAIIMFNDWQCYWRLALWWRCGWVEVKIFLLTCQSWRVDVVWWPVLNSWHKAVCDMCVCCFQGAICCHCCLATKRLNVILQPDWVTCTHLLPFLYKSRSLSHVQSLKHTCGNTYSECK